MSERDIESMSILENQPQCQVHFQSHDSDNEVSPLVEIVEWFSRQ